jgi:hypothetical protein
MKKCRRSLEEKQSFLQTNKQQITMMKYRMKFRTTTKLPKNK